MMSTVRKVRKHSTRHHTRHTKLKRQNWILRYRFAIIGFLSAAVLLLGGINYLTQQSVLGAAIERNGGSTTSVSQKTSISPIPQYFPHIFSNSSSGTPTRPGVWVSCATNTFTASWNGNQGVYYVDIGLDGGFNKMYNKRVSGSSTTGPNGFNPYKGVTGPLTLKLGQTYYVRVYNGRHSATYSFTVTQCVTPTPVVYPPLGVRIHVQTADGHSIPNVPVHITDSHGYTVNGLSNPAYKTNGTGDMFFTHTQDHGPLRLSVVDQAGNDLTKGSDADYRGVFVDGPPLGTNNNSGTCQHCISSDPLSCGSNQLHQPACLLVVKNSPNNSSIFVSGLGHPRTITLNSIKKVCTGKGPYNFQATWTTDYYPSNLLSTFEFVEYGQPIDPLNQRQYNFNSFNSIQHLTNTFYTFTGTGTSSNDHGYDDNLFTGSLWDPNGLVFGEIADITSSGENAQEAYYSLHSKVIQVNNCSK